MIVKTSVEKRCVVCVEALPSRGAWRVLGTLLVHLDVRSPES